MIEALAGQVIGPAEERAPYASIDAVIDAHFGRIEDELARHGSAPQKENGTKPAANVEKRRKLFTCTHILTSDPQIVKLTASDHGWPHSPSRIMGGPIRRHLKQHLVVAHRNLEFGRFRRFEQLEWKTGELPVPRNIIQMGGGLDFEKSIQGAMNFAIPYLSACLVEFKGGGHNDAFAKLRDAIDAMYKLGAKHDVLIDRLLS